ncbi:hypothetical protein D9M73_185440 [compost metagenome]
MTSVWILAVSTSLNGTALRQNSEVSVASGSITTSHLSLLRAAVTRFLSGKAAIGLKPWQK